MKKCKYCQTEIDSKAKVCPNCHKKQSKPILYAILIIIGIIFFGSIFGGDSESTDEKQTGTTSTEKLTLLEGHNGRVESNYSYEITGTIENNTDTEYSYVQVEFYAYDNDGNLLDTCLANNSGLEPHGKWKFTASCFFSNGDASKVSSYKLKEITKW